MHTIDVSGLSSLLTSLSSRGYHLIGPTIRDGTIVLDAITSPDDLPHGWCDHQDTATYTLVRDEVDAFFHTTCSPTGWRRFLVPPRERLFAARGRSRDLSVVQEPHQDGLQAFIGVRPCELHAIAVLDRVFLSGAVADAAYQHNRSRTFILAAQCTRAGGTCFCASTGTGPSAHDLFDIALTEVLSAERHFFVVEAASERGRTVLGDVPHTPSTPEEMQMALAEQAAAASGMKRSVDLAGARAALNGLFDSPSWDDIAKRCLGCANCTMVCPTCFCTTVEERTDLAGSRAERWRTWDSCFSVDYARVAGGNFRVSGKSRYRQWLTHKFLSWEEQFGVQGCVGCGRCITWCPVGIDCTGELRMLQQQARMSGNGTQEPSHQEV